MNERETAVCSRVREIRVQIKWSQSDFAKEINVSRDKLASIEYGRTPLRYSLAKTICRTFDVQPRWLATGDGEMRPYVWLFMTAEQAARFSDNSLLTEVYDRLPGIFPPFLTDTPLRIENCPADFDFMEAVVRNARFQCDITKFKEPGYAYEFTVAVNEFMRKKLAAYRARGVATRSPMNKTAARFKQQREGCKEGLTSSCQSAINAPMKLPRDLEQLREWLRKRTQARGAKAALAREIEESLPDVSRWISGTRVPDGEQLLKLLNRVWAPEHK